MKAKIYISGFLVGETEIADVNLPVGNPLSAKPVLGQQVVIAFVDDHASPQEKPLFLEGRLEWAHGAA